MEHPFKSAYVTFHNEQNVQQFGVHSTVYLKSATGSLQIPWEPVGGQVLIRDSVTILT